MAFTFTVQQMQSIKERNGQVCATLVPRSHPERAPRHGQLKARGYSREFRVLDGEGVLVETRSDPVMEKGRRAKLTVLSVEPINVYAGDGEAERWPSGGRALGLPDARACGHRTVDGLREDWKQLHQHMDLAKLVWFALGDLRDSDRYLARGFADYIHAYDPVHVVDELPALTPEQLAELAVHNGQRHLARQMQQAQTMAGESLAQRVARIEAAGTRLTENEIAIIRERARRGLKRIST